MNLSRINIDDRKLVQQCLKGDPCALERLVLKYEHRLHNVIQRICRNPDDAAELTQETFVKIIENLERFEGKSSFYTWAFRIAVNLSLNHCRKASKVSLRSLEADALDHSREAVESLRHFLENDKAPDPSDIAQNREVCDLIQSHMMRLEEDHRTILVLRDIEGMSYAQIAKVLEIELGTVRSRLSRARQKFREILETVLT